MNQPLSLAGTPAASPLGYYSWAFGQAARDPFYIMVVIYIFFPYFSSVVVGDPVRGQALIGYINASVGFVLAATILFSVLSPTPSAGVNPGYSLLTEPSL